MKKTAVSLLVLVSLSVALASTLGAGGAQAGANKAAFGLNCALGLTDELVPLVLRDNKHRIIPPKTYNFKQVCIQHDKCYAHWGLDQGNCDHAFILNMFAECNRQPKAAQHGCEYVALKYHDAVVRNGAAAYKQAQVDAIVAGFKGDYTGVGRLFVNGGPSGTASFPWQSSSLGQPMVKVVAAGDGLFLQNDGPNSDVINIGELDVVSDPPFKVTATVSDDSFPGYLPPGYVGGVVQVDLTFTWDGELPPSVTGTFSGGSLVDDAHQEPVTFSGSFTASKPING
jgi:hypothetical protein